jgi:hypothetical protein
MKNIILTSVRAGEQDLEILGKVLLRKELIVAVKPDTFSVVEKIIIPSVYSRITPGAKEPEYIYKDVAYTLVMYDQKSFCVKETAGEIFELLK